MAAVVEAGSPRGMVSKRQKHERARGIRKRKAKRNAEKK